MSRSRWLAGLALLLSLPGLPAAAENGFDDYGPAVNQDLVDRARRFRTEHPNYFAAAGTIVQYGEVLVMQGDDQTVLFDGARYGVQTPNLMEVTRRTILQLGDQFHSITIWLTFVDASSESTTIAYEQTVKNDIRGLGRLGIMDRNRNGQWGGQGTLRSVLNMKRGLDSVSNPNSSILAIWGHESAHRWLIFFDFLDPRTGRASDALLGRQCAHYSRFVESQASVMDGNAWKDNGDGTFTVTEGFKRYGNLDLYAMGLLAADELPPFFLIDEIPFEGGTYVAPPCGTAYDNAPKPGGVTMVVGTTVPGKRIDVDIDAITAVNGKRIPNADDGGHYWREAEVILTLPTEQPSDVQTLAERLDGARSRAEDWLSVASQHRLVICTQLSKDCGDPKSEIARVTAQGIGQAPTASAGLMRVNVDVANNGGRLTTGVRAGLEVTLADRVLKPMQDVGDLAVGERRTLAFDLDLEGVPCGTELPFKAFTQSDFHYDRVKQKMFAGAEDKYTEDFETDTGWKVNPAGDDTAQGATWELGAPQDNVIAGTLVQIAAAHNGAAAWVTGAAGGSDTWVVGGKRTLESPPYDAAGLRDPMLRYWVSFSGVSTASGKAVPSPDDRLIVLVKSDASDWVEIDRLQETVTTGWEQRNVPLPAQIPLVGQLRFRFVAEAAAVSGVVEAAIDDVQVTSKALQCFAASGSDGGTDGGGDGGDGGDDGPAGKKDDGGCGCRIGVADEVRPGGPGGAAAAVALAGLIRYRRRTRRAPEKATGNRRA